MSGDFRELSRRAISAIAKGLVKGRFDDRGGHSRRGLGVFDALFYAHLDSSDFGNHDTFECCNQIVQSCVDSAAKHGADLPLFGGWAGLGWVTTHISATDDFVGNHTDQILLGALEHWPERRGYDLISGLIGAGVYFLERLPTDVSRRALYLVLENLEQSAVETPDGTTWFTYPSLLPAWQREQAPRGYYNLGVAHGVPGVCWLLGKLCAAEIETERAESLLRGSLRWLRSHQPDPKQPELPSWIAPGVEREPNRRMAWCYGPLGASAVTLEAAKAIGDDEGVEWVRSLALSCAEVPPVAGLVRDAGLCHGAAGNAQIFYRLYRNTGETKFQEAALAWIEATLGYRRPGEGIGGFQMWGDVGGNRQGWADDGSFLTGSAGVGLALLAAVTEIEPKWDRLLLLS